MSTRFLEPSINGRPVGTLKDEQGWWAFTYDSSWLKLRRDIRTEPAFAVARRILSG